MNIHRDRREIRVRHPGLTRGPDMFLAKLLKISAFNVTVTQMTFSNQDCGVGVKTGVWAGAGHKSVPTPNPALSRILFLVNRQWFSTNEYPSA